MFVVMPPNETPKCQFTIFLAGSIEMGKAVDWQSEVIKSLTGKNCTLLNPRRKDWDSSWAQSATHKEFSKQVAWEMNGIENSDLVVFYLDPDTASPISLMELGWVAGLGKKSIVCCPDGFWRKGNVDLLCIRNGIRQVNNLNDFINEIIAYLTLNGI